MSHCHRIIQLSDLHLFSDKKRTLLDINTYDSFFAVLSLLPQIISEKPVSLIVLTGDLSQDGSTESYQHCINDLQQMDCPIAWIPGNHDSVSISESVLGCSHFSNEKHFMFPPWQIILLNSAKKGQVSGYLAPDQLLFLKHKLNQCKDYALVMLHHHILPVKTAWLDKLNLQNSDAFLKSIAEFSNVKAVVCGHVHIASHVLHAQVDYYSSPATSVQFKQHAEKFTLEAKMPGLRILDLYDNGEIITSVVRIPYCDQFLPNDQSEGY